MDTDKHWVLIKTFNLEHLSLVWLKTHKLDLHKKFYKENVKECVFQTKETLKLALSDIIMIYLSIDTCHLNWDHSTTHWFHVTWLIIYIFHFTDSNSV